MRALYEKIERGFSDVNCRITSTDSLMQRSATKLLRCEYQNVCIAITACSNSIVLFLPHWKVFGTVVIHYRNTS